MTLLRKTLKILAVIFAIGLLILVYAISHNGACKQNLSETTGPSMKAVTQHCYGSPDTLTFEEVEKPTLEEDEVLVKVKSAAVNPLDWRYLRGEPYVIRFTSGFGTPNDPRSGVDFAGVVESVGDKVTEFKPGDEVFGGANGAFAEYLKVRDNRSIVHKPDDVSFEQVAAMPIAALTALQALRDYALLKPGQTILINGSSGGVGTYAVQIAKAFGAEITAVCSTRNVELVKSLGADYVVDYKKQDFVTQDKKYDIVMDNVGNRSISEYLKVLKPNGILVTVGGSKGTWLGPLKNMAVGAVTAPFVNQTIETMTAKFNKKDLQILAELLQNKKIKSVIDRRYPLNETIDAIRYSETGRARGKIMINFNDIPN